jgi:hypothetical protein
LNDREIALPFNRPLLLSVAEAEIRGRAEARDADFFALEVFHPLYFRTSHDDERHHVHRAGDYHQIPAGNIGADDGPAGKDTDRDFARLDYRSGAPAAGNIEKFHVEAVLAENTGFERNPDRRLRPADGAID